MVQSDRKPFGLTYPLSCFVNGYGFDTTYIGGFFNRTLHDLLAVGLKPIRMADDKFFIQESFLDQDAAYGVVEGNVRTRTDRQVQVGGPYGIRCARVDGNNLHVRIGRFMRLDPPPDNGMAPGRISPLNIENIRLLDIIVAYRYRIFTQR